MRSVETEEHSEVEASTVQRQSEPGRAAVAATAPPIVSIPVVQPNSVGIQTKLTVGAIGDVYEQEADRVAAQVMSMPVAAAAPPQVQRFGVEDSPIGMYSSLARSITPMVQRQVDEQVQMRELVQRAFQSGGNEASGDLESRLNASKGGGSALAPEVRAFMEPRFGADFSGVRVHTGGEAVQMNRELGAQAFAHGSDVYFGAGKSPGNNELTAHELTHVVQQTGGVQRQLSVNDNEQDIVRLKSDFSKAAKKVKPFTVSGSGDRKLFIPKKPNGKTLYFFFGYTGSEKDQKMRDEEAPEVEDDVLNAAARGFKVVYDKAGSQAEFFDAVYDAQCYGIYWSGHGYVNGNIQSSDGKVIRPEDVDETKRSKNIRYLILAACGSGLGVKRWQKVMGSQCQFEGWVDLTYTSETKDFTSSSWLDSWASHKGMNSDKELQDYINDAEQAK
jgi:hypothetical protein